MLGFELLSYLSLHLHTIYTHLSQLNSITMPPKAISAADNTTQPPAKKVATGDGEEEKESEDEDRKGKGYKYAN